MNAWISAHSSILPFPSNPTPHHCLDVLVPLAASFPRQFIHLIISTGLTRSKEWRVKSKWDCKICNRMMREIGWECRNALVQQINYTKRITPKHSTADVNDSRMKNLFATETCGNWGFCKRKLKFTANCSSFCYAPNNYSLQISIFLEWNDIWL